MYRTINVLKIIQNMRIKLYEEKLSSDIIALSVLPTVAKFQGKDKVVVIGRFRC